MRPPASMSPLHRVGLQAAFLVLTVSGVAAELAPHWRGALMQIHGAAAMAALVVVGGLLVAHVGRGWAERRNRWSGAMLLGGCLWLTVTGYVLYYSGSDALRQLAASGHFWAGVALVPVLGTHVWGMIAGSRTPSGGGSQ